MNYILGLITVWNLIPHLLIWTRPDVHAKYKLSASKDMLVSSYRGLLVLIPDLLAPLVMLVVLPFVKYQANHLPKLFTWWDNDVSINGDQAEGEATYYAPGHDRRGFYARYIWLGWRNRASRLSQLLGHTWKDKEEYNDWTSWGDPATGRNHQGWSLNRRGPRWQIYMVTKLPFNLCLRTNFGFKVWAGEGDKRSVANVVGIAFSILRWRG